VLADCKLMIMINKSSLYTVNFDSKSGHQKKLTNFVIYTYYTYILIFYYNMFMTNNKMSSGKNDRSSYS